MKTNNLNELSLRSKFALGITILENAFVNTRTDHPVVYQTCGICIGSIDFIGVY
jgi:hypothetical protein